MKAGFDGAFGDLHNPGDFGDAHILVESQEDERPLLRVEFEKFVLEGIGCGAGLPVCVIEVLRVVLPERLFRVVSAEVVVAFMS